MVSLPPHAVLIKFIDDDVVAILWTYLDIPSSTPGKPTLYDFYLDLGLEAWATLEYDDDHGFEWQTYFNRRSIRQEVNRASQSSGFKMRR